MQRLQKNALFNKRDLHLILIIVILGFFISYNAPEFIQVRNLSNILGNNSVYGIMAIGMTLILVTGNIDISVGAVFAITGMTAASFANYADAAGITTPFLVFAVSMLAGAALGFINGYLVAKIKLPAIIITLGNMSIMRGLLLLLTQGAWVSGMPEWLTVLARTKYLGLYASTYLWLFTALFVFALLKFTVLGRGILAVGGNSTGAQRIGINQKMVYIFVFSVFGALTGLASTIYIANLGSAQPVAGMGYELTLIAASIIGGTSIFGGKASILGTCLGVILLGIIANAMVLALVPVYWQSLVTGLVIILAILFSYREERI
ncbi:MAG: ABC transporter permease [Syntrophomonadaceae bacterium]|nr:ABC transporter permease [Syntrophomonadaceae bacterium]